MNTTLIWIIVAVVLILLVLGVIIVAGNKRKQSKTVSFEKKDDDQPQELTQQEKSGNYQAKGGFNFAPATAEEKEPVRVDEPLTHPESPQVTEPLAAKEPEPEPEAASVRAELQHEEKLTEPIADEGDADDEDQGTESATDRLSTASAAVAGGASAAAVEGVAASQADAQDPQETQDAAGDEPERDVTVEKDTAELADGMNSDDDAPATAPDSSLLEETDQLDEDESTAEAVLDAEDQTDVIDEAEEAAGIAAVTADVADAAREETERPAEPAPSPEPEQPIDEIEPVAGRIGRLRGRLSRSQNAIGQGLLGILTAGDLDEDAWEEIEDTLIMADLGSTLTMKVTDSLREKIAERGVSNEDEARAMLRETLVEAGQPDMDRSIKALPHEGKPAVILVVGVNGTGKTTTTGKLARVLVSMGSKVVLGAADTFRAAAADQLETWGRRVGATTVRGKEGADPASVAFDAVAQGVEEHADVVIVDTAGRLHTSTGLMDQLGKVKRVVEKKSNVDEVLLVIDATVGQNGLTQARVFRDVVDITGVVLTKLDGTAKGGIVFQVQEELGVPVKLVGLGEGADDLAPFEVEGFVDALLG